MGCSTAFDGLCCQLRLIDLATRVSELTSHIDEPFDGLDRDADTEGQKEDTVEERAQDGRTRPTKGEGFRRRPRTFK